VSFLPQSSGADPLLVIMFAQDLAEVQYRVLYGCTIAFMVTSAVAVAMRMYVRTVILKKIGYDDWALVLALVRSVLVPSYVTCVLMCIDILHNQQRNIVGSVS